MAGTAFTGTNPLEFPETLLNECLGLMASTQRIMV
jgi:hypothetical protein